MTAPRLRRPVAASLPFVGLAAAVLATSAWVPRPMPLLSGRERAPREQVAQSFVSESQSVGDTRSRVAGSSTSTASIPITHSITAASVEGQRATDAQRGAAPPSLSVEPVAAEASAAQAVQGNPTPRYPESLRDAHIEGVVFVAFSTDARGVPDTTTIKIVASTNELFTAEVRRVLPEWRLVANDSVRLAFRFMMEQGEPHFTYDSVVPVSHAAMGTRVGYLTGQVTNLVFDGLDFVPVLITGVVPRAMQQREGTWRPSGSFQRDPGHPLVGRDPKPLPGNPAPRYPDALRASGTEGHVLLTFSTDARGVPDTTTLNVVWSTNDQFTNAVRRVLPNWRYDSAGRVRFACRFMTLETEQKEAAASNSPTFTIEGIAVLPVVVVSATPANKKSLDSTQVIGISSETTGDQQIIPSGPLSAVVDTIAARLASLEVERLSWLASEPTSGAPQNDVEVQIRSLREQLRRLPERDSANRVVDARVAAALDARESELKGRLRQLRLVYTDNYPIVKDVARAERLVEERKAELRRTTP